MPEVIKWAVIGGILVFTLGLTSAFGSRWRAKRLRADYEEHATVIHEIAITRLSAGNPDISTSSNSTKNDNNSGVMSMVAGGGQLNGEENLASVGNHSR